MTSQDEDQIAKEAHIAALAAHEKARNLENGGDDDEAEAAGIAAYEATEKAMVASHDAGLLQILALDVLHEAAKDAVSDRYYPNQPFTLHRAAITLHDNAMDEK